MAKVTTRIASLEVVFVLAVLAVLGRAAQLQIVQRSKWESEAEEQRKRSDQSESENNSRLHRATLARDENRYHLLRGCRFDLA